MNIECRAVGWSELCAIAGELPADICAGQIDGCAGGQGVEKDVTFDLCPVCSEALQGAAGEAEEVKAGSDGIDLTVEMAISQLGGPFDRGEV